LSGLTAIELCARERKPMKTGLSILEPTFDDQSNVIPILYHTQRVIAKPTIKSDTTTSDLMAEMQRSGILPVLYQAIEKDETSS